ncbi:MAG TPA: sigma-70 family RNA polymerase sigma factor [Chloroflexota bacterium]
MDPEARRTDGKLASKLARREVDALAELYDRYGGLAYSVAMRILGDAGRAEDVVQESFLKVWNGMDRFDPARGDLRGWLLTSVRNRSVDHLRGRAGHERQEMSLASDVPAPSSGQDPWQAVAASLQSDAVREALDTLPSEQRQVVELAYFGGYSGREIGAIACVPLSTVKGRMRLALEKLHSYLLGRGWELDG